MTEIVVTAHGRMIAEPGDWILQDTRTGDIWPVKQDIFANTYESVVRLTPKGRIESG